MKKMFLFAILMCLVTAVPAMACGDDNNCGNNFGNGHQVGTVGSAVVVGGVTGNNWSQFNIEIGDNHVNFNNGSGSTEKGALVLQTNGKPGGSGAVQGQEGNSNTVTGDLGNVQFQTTSWSNSSLKLGVNSCTTCNTGGHK